MKFKFIETPSGLIYLKSQIFKEDKSEKLNLVLDTGASRTIIAPEYLNALGYNFKDDNLKKEIFITGGNIVQASVIRLDKITVLGHSITELEVYAHSFPRQSLISGVVGNDFLRHYVITINYPEKWVELL